MKKIILLAIFAINFAFGQSSVLIQPNDNNGILSKNSSTITYDIDNISLPVSGAGTRLLWIPAKSAFRVGTVELSQWNASNIGTWSFAAGRNTKANGTNSTSLGDTTTASGNTATSMGSGTTASGDFSTSMGSGTEASGFISTAFGNNSIASGFLSTSMGNSSTASGNTSTSMGYSTLASGNFSTSMGGESKASGNYSTSMGENTESLASHSVVLGRFNILSGNSTSWIDSDPLFTVGNGADNENRNNALTLLKNGHLGLGVTTPGANLDVARGIGLFGTAIFRGTVWSSHFNYATNEHTYIRGGKNGSNVYINDQDVLGKVVIGNIANPEQILDVNGRIRVRYRGEGAGIWFSNNTNGLTNNDGAFFGLFNSTAGSETAGIWLGNAWRFYVDRAGNGTLTGAITATNGNFSGGISGITGTFTSCVTASNVTCPSDFRFKKNITPIENALSSIFKLNGVRYDWRKDEFPERKFSDKNQIGFIAQEIEKIFPEIVHTDEKGFKSVDYGRLTPVLVEAIKELKTMNEVLKNSVSNLNNDNQKLESRLEKLEGILIDKAKVN